jgi:Tol biopolymer transport system component
MKGSGFMRISGRACLRVIGLAVVVLVGGPVRTLAQEDYYHPELDWMTIETEHFYVHYHTGAERTGRVVAKIAEEIYAPVTSLYDHKPDQKVSFIIRDYDDISNGAAYFYENKVEIYAPSMDFDLRGTHNWLRNVITHEFTHIVQIQTAMKFGRTMPGFYLQWLGYEPERRPDVLYGFPNVIVSYPISGFVVPVWFAEGVAQYNRADLGYDFWDSHRDMILRSYALDKNLLTWEQMAVFGKTSLGNESSYNAGFAFVHYLARTYGEEKLNEISRNLARLTAATIDGAIERAVGKPGSEVYADWRAEVERDYAVRVAPILTARREGDSLIVLDDPGGHAAPDNREPQTLPIRPGRPNGGPVLPCCSMAMNTGFANLYPAYSPDGSKIAYVSNKTADYFSQSSLYVYDVATKTEQRLVGGVRTGISWSPDGKRIYYGRNTRENPHGSLQCDLHVYDIGEEEETRLTRGARGLSPAVSPDGRLIAFTVTADGTSNLAIVNADGSGYHQVTAYLNGEQVYNPKWSPGGDRIIFDYSIKDGRDIASINPDGSDLRFLVTGEDDSRLGTYTRDGLQILFSSDRTGIFNLYRYTIATGSIEQLTNVLGGAFMPTVAPSGDIVYATYTSGGYKIVRITAPAVIAGEIPGYIRSADPVGTSRPVVPASDGHQAPQFDWPALRTYDDTVLPPLASRPYKSKFTTLSVVPFLRIDNYNTGGTAADAIKPGVYLFSNDLLEKTGLFASAAINLRWERDLFLEFDYRGKIPLLFSLGIEPVAAVQLFNVTRTTENFITLGNERLPIDVSYNLLEFGFSLKEAFPGRLAWLFDPPTAEFRYAHSRYTSIIETFLNPFTGQFVPGSSDLYLIANTFALTLTVDNIFPARTSEISPVGRKFKLTLTRELNKFNGDGEYEVTSTGLRPLYKTINFTRIEGSWRQSMPFLFNGHTLTASLRGGSILGPPVDDFFDFYAGGLIGMKGYPFYSLGGNEMAVAGLEYRLPLVNNLDIRLFQLYFDKLYASVYTDIGHAWTGPVPPLRAFKTDAGMEIRLESFSWYAYPTRIFFDAAYGFDQFNRFVASRNATVTYGKEMRFYFGVLFGFDFD